MDVHIDDDKEGSAGDSRCHKRGVPRETEQRTPMSRSILSLYGRRVVEGVLDLIDTVVCINPKLRTETLKVYPPN